MRIILSLLIIILLASCNKEANHTFFYTNGSIIRDTNQLKALNRELNSILSKQELNGDLKIFTSFSNKQNQEFARISKRYASYVLDTLKKTFPEKVRFLDSMNSINRLSNVSIICINNITGEVENCAFNHSSELSIFENRLEHKAIHPYGYIMTFEKGKEVDDTFAYEVNQQLEDRFKMLTNYTVSESFRYIPSANVMIRPYYFYPRSDWERINQNMHLNLDLSEFEPRILPPIKTSLYDLTKTISTIQNRGDYQKPLYIRKVKNSQEKEIYTAPKNQRKRIIDVSVAQKMKTLFDHYMKGQGKIQARKNGINEDCIIYTGDLYDFANWCVYSGKDYTIGIIEYNQLRMENHSSSMNRRKEKVKVSIMLKDILRTLK